ncbi:hypothetical protein DMB66_10975 [Actinoplanes sp. ATCC 53533]|nr:hypothetical protein DMB66_10975 [Actinoplanes sp. ATCC 53533]
MLSRMSAGTGIVGAFGAAAASRFAPSHVFVGIVVALLVVAFVAAAVPCLRAFSLARRRDLYLPFGIALLALGVLGAVAGTHLPMVRFDRTATPCLPTASIDSPRVGELVTRNTDVYGRGTMCGDNYLWVVTRSTNGEYVARTRDPIAVNGDGNWIDPMPAVLSRPPPLKITYCVLVTDARMTTAWKNRFKTIPLDGTLDLSGLARPERCLAEVTVRTR